MSSSNTAGMIFFWVNFRELTPVVLPDPFSVESGSVSAFSAPLVWVSSFLAPVLVGSAPEFYY